MMSAFGAPRCAPTQSRFPRSLLQAARPSRNQTECARPRAQQLGTADELRDDPERGCEPELLRPGRPHSGKFARLATISGDTSTVRFEVHHIIPPVSPMVVDCGAGCAPC